MACSRRAPARRLAGAVTAVLAGTIFALGGQPLPTRCPLSDTPHIKKRGRNVLGKPLEVCSLEPRTGFFRDGCCRTGTDDVGLHVVCARMTAEFLEFSRARGNDLSTPVPAMGFPGLQPGDRWCLCALRWKEALQAGVAPPVVLEATHVSTLEFVDLEVLREHAADPAR